MNPSPTILLNQTVCSRIDIYGVTNAYLTNLGATFEEIIEEHRRRKRVSC
jgi:hypothetical protein